jgi:hypothetical protein
MNPGQNPVSTNTNKSGLIFLSAVQVNTKQSRGKKNMLSTSGSFLLAASNPESVVTEITIRSCGLLFLRRRIVGVTPTTSPRDMAWNQMVLGVLSVLSLNETKPKWSLSLRHLFRLKNEQRTKQGTTTNMTSTENRW